MALKVIHQAVAVDIVVLILTVMVVVKVSHMVLDPVMMVDTMDNNNNNIMPSQRRNIMSQKSIIIINFIPSLFPNHTTLISHIQLLYQFLNPTQFKYQYHNLLLCQS